MKRSKFIRKTIQLLAFLPITVIFLKNMEYFPVVILILTALAGAFYCGYLCPFGFLQEIFSILGDKLNIKKRTMPKSVSMLLKSIRYILFILITVLSIDALFSILKFDARSNLYLLLTGKTITYVMTISIIIFSVISMVYRKPFCNYFCIKGAGYGLLSKFRLFSIRRNEEACIDCKLCDKVCALGVDVSTHSHVDSMSCVNCFDCIGVCPRPGTLSFGPLSLKASKKKLAFGICASVFALGYFFILPKTTLNDKGASQTASLLSKENAEKETQAKPTDDNAEYFEGEAEGYQGKIKVKVGMDNGKIVSVKVLEHSEDFDWYSKAKGPIIDAVIASQSAEVDVVSGATFTSEGIINAVKDALSQVK